MVGLDQKRQKLDLQLQPQNVVRSLDACRRCRLKKVKCDQNFPTCLRCEKSGSECVGIDRATGKMIPRSYVYYLEQKIASLENMLNAHGVNSHQTSVAHLPPDLSQSSSKASVNLSLQPIETPRMESLSGKSDIIESPTYLGASLGITFAKLITAAVKMRKETPDIQVDQLKNPPPVDQKPASLPAKGIAQIFVSTFFTHSNSQLPILHRELFLTDFFEPIYGSWDDKLSPTVPPLSRMKRNSTIAMENTWIYRYKNIISQHLSNGGAGGTNDILQLSPLDIPEQFHRPLFYLNIIFAIASSVNHLQYMNSISEQFRTASLEFIRCTYTTKDPLEQLQAELLQSIFSIMRPCKPGIWHSLGRCLRICVELGLHNDVHIKHAELDAFTIDRRRRLFWCTYSLDRQVCFYMGRPVGIPEGSVKTSFPSELDDAYILKESPGVPDYSKELGGMLSCKSISIAFFRIRKLQLEVQRVLYEGEEIPRRFVTLDEWKTHIEIQLDEWWRRACELQKRNEIDFHVEFFSLNYNHTLLLLNGLSPRNFKLSQGALIKVAETSRNLIDCYILLYNKRAINYTWAAVHNLSMAGTSFLYALYHSEKVRDIFSKENVLTVSEGCATVLSLLIASCNAARDCLQMFRILTAAIIKICYGGSTQESKREIESQGFTLISPVQTKNSIKLTKFEMADQLRVSNLINSEADSNNFVNDSTDEYSFDWVPSKMKGSGIVSEVMFEEDPIGIPGSNFETFLAEIQNQSPGTSVNDTAEESLSEYALDVENASSKLYPLVKDGRKAFDLIQLPTEFIWDQYFTDPKEYVSDERNS